MAASFLPATPTEDLTNRKRIRSPIGTSPDSAQHSSPDNKKVRNQNNSIVFNLSQEDSDQNLNMALATEATVLRLVGVIDNLASCIDQTCTKEDLRLVTVELVSKKEFEDLNDHVLRNEELLKNLTETATFSQQQNSTDTVRL